MFQTEALKPHRSHLFQRPTTPLVLAERGIENIRISSATGGILTTPPGDATNAAAASSKCDSPTIVQQQVNQLPPSHSSHHVHFDQNRSVSPPAKVFHCAVSPSRRRQSRHQTQRLQRPHRPCLDFDKMQQVCRNSYILEIQNRSLRALRSSKVREFLYTN